MDGKALSTVITRLGGSIVDGASFSFPVNRIREAIPKLNDLGIQCKTVRQFTGVNSRNGTTETIAVFTAHTKPEPAPLKGGYGAI